MQGHFIGRLRRNRRVQGKGITCGMGHAVERLGQPLRKTHE
jgi:hypothetical protein